MGSSVCRRNGELNHRIPIQKLMIHGRMFNMALSGTRDESTYVNQQLVQQDVEALYRAGPGKIGTVSTLRSSSRNSC